MNKFIILLVFGLCLTSCTTKNVSQIEKGVFQREKSGEFLGRKGTSVYQLMLCPDGTFYLYYNSIYSNRCKGKWFYIDKNLIQLECQNSVIGELSAEIGSKDIKFPLMEEYADWYMSVRERKVKVINANKIKLQQPESETHKYIVLKRIVDD